MSGLIKSAMLGAAVAAPRLPSAVRAAPAAPAPDPLLAEIAGQAREIESLKQALAERDTRIGRLKGAAEEAEKKGEARGRSAGLAEGAERGAASLQALRGGVDRALARLAEDLVHLERLAPLLAREGLARILGNPDRHAELVMGAVARQLEIVGRQAMLRIEVSAEDFPDRGALSDLVPSVEVAVRDDLASGDCRIVTRLGALEVGPRQQWESLGDLLVEMSQEGAA